jgi:site-specific recombinase XerD
MLASCDRRSAQGCRDYAVLVVLTRLGMRVGEVAAVEFDDIDWHRGELMVRGKAKRFERLPLAVDVGQALADYIQHARPTSSDRKLFLRVVAPHRGLTTGGLIMIVRSACRRAGIEPVAAHRLRHTVASELLRAGAGLSEIGQLLRHRSIASTAIYAFLLRFAAEHAGKAPSQLDLVDLDAPLIGAFLDHLEHDRHNSVRTRNNRLVAVHSLFGFAALREPSHAEHIQRVLAIPQKRFERAIVSFLNRGEIDAILASPDTATWIGRRDRALLLTVIQTGLRVSELTGVRRRDVVLAHGPHVYCRGKGRKERCTPLTAQTVTVLRSWLQERDGDPDAPLFPSRRGDRLSIDAVERLVDKYVNRAARGCPSLDDKRVTPHVLRHSTAMELLAASVDSSVIALWLGHESLQSTQMYLHADMAIKQRALDRTAPHADAVGRYQPPDALIAYLDSL